MTEHDDDPLVRALQAPATPAELTGEARALRAYRDAFAPPAAAVATPGRSGRPGRTSRTGRRLGIAGGTLVVGVALGTGVAAAFTSTLPDPVQGLAHRMLGPVGVPAPERGPAPPARADLGALGGPADPDFAPPGTDPGATGAVPPTSPSAGSTSPGPGAATRTAPGEPPSPSRSPGRSSPSRQARPDPTTPPAAQPPTPPPTTAPPTTAPPTTAPPSPTPTPTPTQVPARVSIAPSTTRLTGGGRVTVTGVVTDRRGRAVPRWPMKLAMRATNGDWRVVATQASARNGSVSMTTPVVDETVLLRLVGPKAGSDVRRVDLQPVVAANERRGVVTVRVRGAQPGDYVDLVPIRRGTVLSVSKRVGADRTVTFRVRPERRRTLYEVRLQRTGRHLAASTRVAVAAR
ncbi:hypothetical protein [Nocardioides litoris]|uniref:hypothetical protein n=1 Tax=Nocardioides litoris TaxID=1926648 RepID=UPI001122A7F2|nr:hypothetical protein [Nocardioides litoris]